jgi:phosphoglycolate phosphatase-like HAD superfamily hydrolase
MRAAELDAVLVDAYGTVMTLADPVPALVGVLDAHGTPRPAAVVRAGEEAEIVYYAPRASEGHDTASLLRLQRDCAAVFLEAVDVPLDPGAFAPAYVGALRFEQLPGVSASLNRARGLGLGLGVVANWDLTLSERLAEVGLAHFFPCVVHAAGKPAPDGLLRAAVELGVAPERALYIGDTESDRVAASAAGVHFAPAPLPAALSALT